MIQRAVNGDGFMSTMDSWKARVTRLTFTEFVELRNWTVISLDVGSTDKRHLRTANVVHLGATAWHPHDYSYQHKFSWR
jgi:hypothetical protein